MRKSAVCSNIDAYVLDMYYSFVKKMDGTSGIYKLHLFWKLYQNIKCALAIYWSFDNILLYMQHEMRSEIYNLILLRRGDRIYR